MKIGTANIQNFPDHAPAQVAEDVRTIAASVSLCGLQEITPGEDSSVVKSVLGDRWWMVGETHETPIIGKSHLWEPVKHHSIPFHRPKLPRPASVHGAVTSVVVRHLVRKGLPYFAVVNVHLVSGGYNGPRLDVVADRWRIEWSMFQDECLRLRKLGLTVYAVGDLNNPRPPRVRPHDSFRWLSGSGIDHIGELARERSVTMSNPTHARVPLNSDHDLVLVRGPLRTHD